MMMAFLLSTPKKKARKRFKCSAVLTIRGMSNYNVLLVTSGILVGCATMKPKTIFLYERTLSICFACSVGPHNGLVSSVLSVEKEQLGIIAEFANSGTMTQIRVYITAMIAASAEKVGALARISFIARYIRHYLEKLHS
jgi:hypothetical protein